MSKASPHDICKALDEAVMQLEALCSPSPSTTPQTTQEQEAIKLHRDLKKLRNTYTSIFKLPNETLVEIFNLVGYPDQIAQICQRWRFVALGTPALWTALPSFHHDRTLRYLKRSKNAPLDVYISKGTASTTTSVILKNIGRIRKLHVDQTLKYLADMQRVRRYAPLLEDLSIEDWCNGEPGALTFSYEAFGLTTKLRKLELKNVCFHWCILLNLPALTHLCLHDITVTHDITGEEFTNTLRAVPLLQDLSMSFGDIELNQYTPLTPLEPIHLPHLTELDIRSRSHRLHIDHFFRHTTLPQLRCLLVDYGDDRFDHSPMVRTLAYAIQNGNFHPLENLELGQRCIRMKPMAFVPSETPYIEALLPVTHVDLDTDHFEMVTHVLSCIAPTNSKEFSSLVRLEIGALELTDDDLEELFGGLPCLEQVGFSWQLADCFIAALSIPLDHDPYSPILFSSLKFIEWHGPPFDNFPYFDSKLCDKLLDCLMQRCEYGAPIHNLALKCCKIGADSVEARLLKEVVVNVSVSTGFW